MQLECGLEARVHAVVLTGEFLYAPLRHHFEQNFHVRRRLERYEAGRLLPYEEVTDPDGLAEVIAKEVGREVHYQPVETDGAARAGAMLAELL